MNKEELLTRLDESREGFLEAIEGLDEQQMITPGVCGDWSIKDILVHLARWEAELVKLLWQVRQGQKPDSALLSALQGGESDDDINARWYKESRNRLLDQALEDFHAVRTQTMRRVESFLDKELTDPNRYKFLEGHPLWEWVAGDSFEHEEAHLPDILAWRKSLNIDQSGS
jgi:hypothetical protein